MEQSIDNSRQNNGQTPAVSPDTQVPGQTAADNTPHPAPPKIVGHFGKHMSSYWEVMVPALSVRYLAETGYKLRRAWHEHRHPDIKLPKEMNRKWEAMYAATTGAAMYAMATFYLTRTYQDLKNVFAEPIAWETGKAKEDVGFIDIMKSENSLVQAAKRNFFKYNARRFAVNLPFFANHLPGPFKKLDPDTAVLAGVGTNAIYLMSDVLTRKETFFERLQGFVDQKIVHKGDLGEKATALDLINLYELHSRDKNSGYNASGRMDTQEWQDRQALFGRMASLINQTYGNEPNKEHANFTLGKMIYLMGHGMIGTGNMERSSAYIETASQYGIEAVKEMAKQPMADGSDVKYAREHYPASAAAAAQEKPAPDQSGGFAAKIAAEGRAAAMSPPGASQTEKLAIQRAAAPEGGMALTA